MKYLIDGYNWLFRLPKRNLSLENKRKLLLENISALTSFQAVDITIVFDASVAQGIHSTRGHFKNLEIVYTTHKLNADDYILQSVEADKRPQHMTVVTMDRGLGAKCKAAGAKVISFDEFFLKITKSNIKRAKLQSASTRELKESPAHFARLLALFEKKLSEDIAEDLF